MTLEQLARTERAEFDRALDKLRAALESAAPFEWIEPRVIPQLDHEISTPFGPSVEKNYRVVPGSLAVRRDSAGNLSVTGGSVSLLPIEWGDGAWRPAHHTPAAVMAAVMAG